ncbi:unnamed protein product [Diatraea saccharalis]|uniref:Ig-like domain-containing protein n=1 Tax=Diatraea saccharalis TaxID=40085 RepID=A0A9N9W884_9NEOP|nr:unnamed protein product [Diatraea saccharalis]
MLLLPILFSITVYVRSLQLTKLHVPTSVQVGGQAHLSCVWQLGPDDVLYSVKWYKDGEEFFRYVPKNQTPLRKFSLPGIEVTEADSFGANLTLAVDNIITSGRYRCEVSGEKPFFPTVSKYGDMQVIVLPDHGPVISGLLKRYRIGDKLLINCVSGRSCPATDLTWYINGEPALSDIHSLEYQKLKGGLTVTKSTLELEVKDVYFKHSRLNVKCLATLHPIYWKSIEQSAIRERNAIEKVLYINDALKFELDDDRERNSSYQIQHVGVFWFAVIFYSSVTIF